jgi:hypothetical protein
MVVRGPLCAFVGSLPTFYSFSEKELDLFTRSSRCGIVPHNSPYQKMCGIVPHSSPYQKMCGTMPHLRQKIQIFI